MKDKTNLIKKSTLKTFILLTLLIVSFSVVLIFSHITVTSIDKLALDANQALENQKIPIAMQKFQDILTKEDIIRKNPHLQIYRAVLGKKSQNIYTINNIIKQCSGAISKNKIKDEIVNLEDVDFSALKEGRSLSKSFFDNNYINKYFIISLKRSFLDEKDLFEKLRINKKQKEEAEKEQERQRQNSINSYSHQNNFSSDSTESTAPDPMEPYNQAIQKAIESRSKSQYFDALINRCEKYSEIGDGPKALSDHKEACDLCYSSKEMAGSCVANCVTLLDKLNDKFGWKR